MTVESACRESPPPSSGNDHLAPRAGPFRQKLPPSRLWSAVAANSEVIANCAERTQKPLRLLR
jgi:hypothetical protein